MKAALLVVLGIVFAMVLSQSAYALVPDWVKNTARWWADGLVTEREFLNAIEYLVENGIIKIDETPANQQVVITPTDSATRLVELGVEELKEDDHEAAILYFDEALKRNPDNVKALVDKGIASARLGKLADAKYLFDQAIKVGERQNNLDYRAVLNAGIAVSIYGNHTDATKYFDTIIANSAGVDPHILYGAYVNKGVMLYEEGRYEEAIVQYDKALELNPGRLGAIVNKANALQEMHRYGEALEWFEKAYKITTDPLRWKPTYVIVE